MAKTIPPQALPYMADAVASARIEGEFCDLATLILYELGPVPGMTIVNEGDYRRVSNMWRATMELRRRPGSRLALDFHRRLFKEAMEPGAEWEAGVWRTIRVYINRGFVPFLKADGEWGLRRDLLHMPPPEEVPSLMAKWDRAMKRDWETEAASPAEAARRAGDAHARFERIHPFPDGNGRVGRALAGAQMGFWGISEVLSEMRHDYYRCLDDPARAGVFFEKARSEAESRRARRTRNFAGPLAAAGTRPGEQWDILHPRAEGFWAVRELLDEYGPDLGWGDDGRLYTHVEGSPHNPEYGAVWE